MQKQTVAISVDPDTYEEFREILRKQNAGLTVKRELGCAAEAYMIRIIRKSKDAE